MSLPHFQNRNITDSALSINVNTGDVEITRGNIIMTDKKTGHKYKLIISDGNLNIEPLDDKIKLKQKITNILKNATSKK